MKLLAIIKQRRCTFFSLLAAIWLCSCTKEEKTSANKPAPLLKEYIKGDGQLRVLQAAIIKSGLDKDSAFSNGGPYTFFAPTDSAFARAGITMATIANYDPARLSLLLKGHIVPGSISSKTLVGFYWQDVNTLHPDVSLKVTRNYHGIFVNGISMAEANIEAGDGVMHKVNQIAFPPSGNLLEVIRGRADLTFLSAVINKMPRYLEYLAEPDTLKQISGKRFRGMTIWAPDNNAFRAMGYPSVAALDAEDPEVLRKMMATILVAERYYVADMMDGLGSLEYGTFLQFTGAGTGRGYQVLEGGATFRTAGNITNPRIIHPDITASNGVLQVLDQILKP